MKQWLCVFKNFKLENRGGGNHKIKKKAAVCISDKKKSKQGVFSYPKEETGVVESLKDIQYRVNSNYYNLEID